MFLFKEFLYITVVEHGERFWVEKFAEVAFISTRVFYGEQSVV